jgi:hypothetical protein
MPPFKPNATVPVPAPTAPSSSSHVFDRFDRMLIGDSARANVVEAPVVGFADDRVHREHAFVARLRERPAHRALGNLSDGQRVRQQDRRFDFTELHDLGRAHELAEAVADDHCRRHLVLEHVAFVRDDGRHAGANTIAFDDRAVADANATHIGDCVERAGIEDTDGHAELAQARALLVFGPCCGHRSKQDNRGDRQQGVPGCR